MMGVSKESISKFLIGNRFHVKLRILSPYSNNGQWFIVSYNSANKQKHHKKPSHAVSQPLANIRANENTMAQ